MVVVAFMNRGETIIMFLVQHKSPPQPFIRWVGLNPEQADVLNLCNCKSYTQMITILAPPPCEVEPTLSV